MTVRIGFCVLCLVVESLQDCQLPSSQSPCSPGWLQLSEYFAVFHSKLHHHNQYFWTQIEASNFQVTSEAHFVKEMERLNRCQDCQLNRSVPEFWLDTQELQ